VRGGLSILLVVHRVETGSVEIGSELEVSHVKRQPLSQLKAQGWCRHALRESLGSNWQLEHAGESTCALDAAGAEQRQSDVKPQATSQPLLDGQSVHVGARLEFWNLLAAAPI